MQRSGKTSVRTGQSPDVSRKKVSRQSSRTATDDGAILEAGRQAPPWTQVHNWVMLSDIHPIAKALYVVLRMYVNRERGDHAAWPGTVTLAKMLGLSRADKVAPYLKILANLGAIDIKRRGMPCRNYYIIHETPPSGYVGPESIQEWCDMHGEALANEREALAKKTAASRTKAQVSSETLPAGVPETPQMGVHVPAPAGLEQDVVEPDVDEIDVAVTPPPLKRRRCESKTRYDHEAEARKLIINELGDDEDCDILIDFLRRDRSVSVLDTYLGGVIRQGGETGIASLVEQAADWRADLDECRDETMAIFSAHFSPRDTEVIANAYVEARAVRCTDKELMALANECFRRRASVGEYLTGFGEIADKRRRAVRAKRRRESLSSPTR
jgi:hypothetical protein